MSKMTLEKLSQLYYLSNEIELHKQRLQELKRMPPAAQNISGDLYNTINGLLQRCINEREEIETFIASVDNDLLRRILIYRFAVALPWEEVAAKVGGGNNAGNVRMICYRFLGLRH